MLISNGPRGDNKSHQNGWKPMLFCMRMVTGSSWLILQKRVPIDATTSSCPLKQHGQIALSLRMVGREDKNITQGLLGGYPIAAFLQQGHRQRLAQVERLRKSTHCLTQDLLR